MRKLSVGKAEILGLLCSEGTHHKYTTSYYGFFKNRGKSGKHYLRTQNIEAVEFTNLDKKLLNHFKQLMPFEYGYSPRVTGIATSLKVRLKKKFVIKDLLDYTDFGCLKWRVPEKIVKGIFDIKSAFIRGLFDGDGSVNKWNVTYTSVNRHGILSVQDLLKSIGIESKLTGPSHQKGNRKPRYDLVIPKRDSLKYKALIGSNHIKKRKRLNMLR